MRMVLAGFFSGSGLQSARRRSILAAWLGWPERMRNRNFGLAEKVAMKRVERRMVQLRRG